MLKIDLKKYNINCSKEKTRPVYEKRYKKNGEEYLKKVDEINIEEDLKEKKLEVSRIKEIFNCQERLKESELIQEYTEDIKIKELQMMQNYKEFDTYEFLNKTKDIENLYNKMPEEIRKKYKNISRFTKEYLPQFTKKAKENLETMQKNKEEIEKKETIQKNNEELLKQITELQKQLGEKENV